MEFKPQTPPMIQPSAVQATVSHVQANPIAIRRPEMGHQPQPPETHIPAPVPTQLLVGNPTYPDQTAAAPAAIPPPPPTRRLVTAASRMAEQYQASAPAAQPQQVPAEIPAPPPTRMLITGASHAQPAPAMSQPAEIPAPPPTRMLVTGASYAQQAPVMTQPVQAPAEIPAPPPTRLLLTGAAPQQQAPVVAQPQAQAEIPAPPPTRMLITGASHPQVAPVVQQPVQAQQAAAIPAPQPTQLLTGAVPQVHAQAQVPQTPQHVEQQRVESPYVAQTPYQASDFEEQPQTPQTYEMAMERASQDPETAIFDSRLTSLAQVPYYSLTQVVANHRALSPSAEIDLPVIEAEDDNFDESDGSRYSNEEKVGEGGTSVVYLANDTRFRRKVALKRFKQISRSNDESEYLTELERTSSISHPYVVSAYDADVDRKGRFIVMEYIHGLDMETVVGKKTLNFSLNRFMNFAHKALEGLEAVHEADLLHLDLKPSNIMLDERESGRDLVKIIDFGRARDSLREDGTPPKGRGLTGSILYSSPEQLLGEEIDVRTDLYSLGCVFYWVLTGTRPFDGPNPVSIMSAHLRHIVTDIGEIIPTLPEWLAKLIMRMMALDKEDRPQSAREVIDLLDTDGESEKVAQFKA